MVAVIQSAIIIVLGLLLGASYPGGLVGMVVLTVCSVLLGTAIRGALATRSASSRARRRR